MKHYPKTCNQTHLPLYLQFIWKWFAHANCIQIIMCARFRNGIPYGTKITKQYYFNHYRCLHTYANIRTHFGICLQFIHMYNNINVCILFYLLKKLNCITLHWWLCILLLSKKKKNWRRINGFGLKPTG